MSEPDIGTFELLSLIDRHGPDWSAAAPDWALREVGDAISREMGAGNLRNVAELTEQGRRLLLELKLRRRAAPPT